MSDWPIQRVVKVDNIQDGDLIEVSPGKLEPVGIALDEHVENVLDGEGHSAPQGVTLLVNGEELVTDLSPSDLVVIWR